MALIEDELFRDWLSNRLKLLDAALRALLVSRIELARINELDINEPGAELLDRLSLISLNELLIVML